MKGTSLGTRETDVMSVLWSVGSGTVAEVREKLPAPLAYTTVLTILRNLEQKGVVAHAAEGRTYRYIPRLAAPAARSVAVKKLLKSLFNGSAEQLLVHLVDDGIISTKDLKRIRRSIRFRRGELAKR